MTTIDMISIALALAVVLVATLIAGVCIYTHVVYPVERTSYHAERIARTNARLYRKHRTALRQALGRKS